MPYEGNSDGSFSSSEVDAIPQELQRTGRYLRARAPKILEDFAYQSVRIVHEPRYKGQTPTLKEMVEQGDIRHGMSLRPTDSGIRDCIGTVQVEETGNKRTFHISLLDGRVRVSSTDALLDAAYEIKKRSAPTKSNSYKRVEINVDGAAAPGGRWVVLDIFRQTLLEDCSPIRCFMALKRAQRRSKSGSHSASDRGSDSDEADGQSSHTAGDEEHAEEGSEEEEDSASKTSASEPVVAVKKKRRARRQRSYWSKPRWKKRRPEGSPEASARAERSGDVKSEGSKAGEEVAAEGSGDLSAQGVEVKEVAILGASFLQTGDERMQEDDPPDSPPPPLSDDLTPTPVPTPSTDNPKSPIRQHADSPSHSSSPNSRDASYVPSASSPSRPRDNLNDVTAESPRATSPPPDSSHHPHDHPHDAHAGTLPPGPTALTATKDELRAEDPHLQHQQPEIPSLPDGTHSCSSSEHHHPSRASDSGRGGDFPSVGMGTEAGSVGLGEGGGAGVDEAGLSGSRDDDALEGEYQDIKRRQRESQRARRRVEIDSQWEELGVVLRLMTGRLECLRATNASPPQATSEVLAPAPYVLELLKNFYVAGGSIGQSCML